MAQLTKEELTLLEALPAPPTSADAKITGVRILEWLNRHPEERRTGEDLFRHLDAHRPGWASYMRCESKDELLREIETLSQTQKRGQILHIECHGGFNGVGGGRPGDSLSWEDLTPRLQALNNACGCNLLVFIAACRGFAGISSLAAGPIAPAVALVGPVEALTEDEVYSAAIAFYDELIGGSAHLQTMTTRSTEGSGKLFEVEPMALLAYESLAEQMIFDARPERRSRRMEAMRSRLLSTGLSHRDVADRMTNFDRIEAQTHQKTWDQMFLLEQHPENKVRFSLDVISLAKQIAAQHGRRR